MARSRKKARSSARRRFKTALVVLISVLLAAIALYLVHLNDAVQRRFAAIQWVLPAQVYAAPMEIYPGMRLSARALRSELSRLGYRKVRHLQGSGSYVARSSATLVYTRPFSFWDGPQPARKLEVLDRNGKIRRILALNGAKPIQLFRFDPELIGSVYPGRSGQDRVLVRLDQVPPLLPKTLILVEDRTFDSNLGVSPESIVRAAWADLVAGRIVQGGSTLTQQLVRNLFLSDRQTLTRKIREALMAIFLTQHVSKNQILQAYLNEVYMGQDGSIAIRGFALASEFYFNKPLAELEPSEIAMLVGIVRGPSYYNPRRYPKRVLARRNLILHMMVRAHLISEAEGARQVQRPLGITDSGMAAPSRYPAFIDLVQRQLRKQYSQQELSLEGLRVFTTLVPRVQRTLASEIDDKLPKIERANGMKPGTLQAAGVVTAVGTGQVEALVGGRGLRYDGYNRALDTKREIGSLAKPFVYLAALQDPNRFNLGTVLPDLPIAVKMSNGQIWRPHNFDPGQHAPCPMYKALADSINLCSVALGLQVGVGPVRQAFIKAGFGAVPALPSIFLGGVNMSPVEVAQIYSTLAGGGYYTPLQAIRDVLTSNGKPLTHYPFEIRKAFAAGPVYLITWAMENVLRIGTGRWAKTVLPAGTVLAGKTGTTNQFRDSWFAGFGARQLAVVWVGRDDDGATRLQGATGALRIWAPLMRDLHARSLNPTPPPDIVTEEIDPASGLRADRGCANAVTLPFLRGYAPRQYASCANAAQSLPERWLQDLLK